MKFNKILLVFGLCFGWVAPTLAAEEVKPVAVVNGVKISPDLLDLMVANSVSQGAKDSPDLRMTLKNELVAREVLAQEARKLKIDQEKQVKTQMQLQQLSLLADSLIARQAEKFNLSDEKLRAEYKRQVDLLADADEFQISHVVTATEAEAKAVIKASKDGEPFEKLAKEKSLALSRQNGGSLGWLLANQITPLISNVVVNMSVGSVTSMPIATPEGWQVIRLDAKHKYKVPSFEDSRQQLINATFAQERADYVQKLMKSAKIQN